jgi:Domain of unknown function (DUF5655)
VHTPGEMMAAVSTGLRERTGQTLEEWVAMVDAAARAAGWQRPTVEGNVDSQYTGAKAALRPIYDPLADELLALGGDVNVEGRSTHTPFVRARQFAAVAPSTPHARRPPAALHRPAGER